jgi:ATP-dependent DNA helicase RecQ
METDECKRTVLLRYFDDVVTEPCGRCSSCIADKSGSTFAAAQPVSTKEQQHAEEKILQAVAELGERFGRTTVAAVLVGESTSTVERFDLSRSTFFSCLREQSVSSVVESIDRLIRSGVLSNGKGDRPVVSISAKGRLLLAEDAPAPLAMPVAMSGRAAAEQSSTAQNTLLGNLQRVRTELASRYSIPARSVATDEQLKALAENKPSTPGECALIRGIGRVFLERYAREFLAVIGDQHQSDATHSAEDNLTARQRELLQLVREGYDVSRIAANSRTAVGSVAAELQDMIMAGVDVPPHQLVPARVVASVRKEIQKNPRAMLKDLRAAIGPESSPAELRIAAAYVRRERQRLGG